MPFNRKMPPNKLTFSIEDFNKFVEILNSQSNCIDEKLSIKSKKLQDKVLKYSVPIKEENEETVLDVRNYNNEMIDLVYILFDYVKDKIETNTNYYEVLTKVRASLKQEKTNKNE